MQRRAEEAGGHLSEEVDESVTRRVGETPMHHWGTHAHNVDAMDLIEDHIRHGGTAKNLLDDPDIQAQLARMKGEEKDNFIVALHAAAHSEQQTRERIQQARAQRKGEPAEYNRPTNVENTARTINTYMKMTPRHGMDVGNMHEQIYTKIVNENPHIKQNEAHRIAETISRAHYEAPTRYEKGQRTKKLTDAQRIEVMNVTRPILETAEKRQLKREEWHTAESFRLRMHAIDKQKRQGELKLGQFVTEKHKLLSGKEDNEDAIRRQLIQLVYHPTDREGLPASGGVRIEGGTGRAEYPSPMDQARAASRDEQTIAELQRVYNRLGLTGPQRHPDIQGGAGGRGIKIKLDDEHINSLAKDLAEFKGRPGDPKYRELEERLTSLQIRTALAWNPNLQNDPAIQALYRKYSDAPRPPKRGRRVTAEEHYRDSGHEAVKGVKGVKAQGEFLRNQVGNTARSVKSGDYYFGYGSGKISDPTDARWFVGPNKEWEITTQATEGARPRRYRERPEVEKPAEYKNITNERLIRPFSSGVHVRLGNRKAKEGVLPDLPANYKGEQIVPLQTYGKVTSRTRAHRNREGFIEKERTSFVPVGKTQLIKGQHDELTVVVPARGRFGERAVTMRLEGDRTLPYSNTTYSEALLAPVRARREAKMREQHEYIANARSNVGKDVALAAGAATVFGTQRRARKKWGPEWVNRTADTLGRRNQHVGRWLTDKGLEGGIFKVDEGAFRPLEETVINWRRMIKHPLESPEGVTGGIDWGPAYYDAQVKTRFGTMRIPVDPETKISRQLSKEARKVRRLRETEAFFDTAAGPNASWLQRRLRGRRDHILNRAEYKEFTTSRHDFIGHLEDRLAAQGSHAGKRRKGTVELQKEIARVRLHARERDFTKAGMLVPYDKHFAASQLGRSSEGFVSRNKGPLLITGAVAGTALGAGYLYHRHQERKKAPEERVALYNKALPGPIEIKSPYIRATAYQTVPKSNITKIKRVPVEWAVGTKKRKIWKGTPEDRGYEQLKTGAAGLRVGGNFGRGEGRFAFKIPYDRKRQQQRGTHRLYIKGKKVPVRLDLGPTKKINLKRKNPNAITNREREDIVATFGLRPWERTSQAPGSLQKKAIEQDIRDFYAGDKRLLKMLDDPETVEKLVRKRLPAGLGTGTAPTSEFLDRARSEEGGLKMIRAGARTRESTQERLDRKFRESLGALGGAFDDE